MLSYERDDGCDPSKLHYSRSECQTMKIAMVHDAREAYQKYLSYSSSNFDSNPESLEITGLENVLNVRLAEKVILHRKRLYSAVLIEQARQLRSGERDPLKISQASQHYSKESVDRAEKVAAFLREELRDNE